MHHYGCPYTCTDIGRTAGQVSSTIIKCIIHMRFKSILYRRSFLPGFFHLEPRIEALDPKMILFINHDTDGFILTKNDSAVLGFIRKTGTNQMFLHQHTFVEFININ
ncbi:hypothetical protein D3C75_1041850 [compost metagenome]